MFSNYRVLSLSELALERYLDLELLSHAELELLSWRSPVRTWLPTFLEYSVSRRLILGTGEL